MVAFSSGTISSGICKERMSKQGNMRSWISCFQVVYVCNIKYSEWINSLEESKYFGKKKLDIARPSGEI